MNLITGSVYNYKLLFIILKNNNIKYKSTLWLYDSFIFYHLMYILYTYRYIN